MSDPFDKDRLERQARNAFLRQDAGRDRDLAVIRAVWEYLSEGHRVELSAELLALGHVADRVSKLTGGLLEVPRVTTCEEAAYEVACTEGKSAPRAYREVGQLRRDVHIRPAELVCAMDCWAAGEPYVPEGPTHPRWPIPEERARWLEIDRLWREATPAADEPAEDSPT